MICLIRGQDGLYGRDGHNGQGSIISRTCTANGTPEVQPSLTLLKLRIGLRGAKTGVSYQQQSIPYFPEMLFIRN